MMRHAKKTDLKIVAAILRKGSCSTYASQRKLREFLAYGGEIVIAADPTGLIFCVMLYYKCAQLQENESIPHIHFAAICFDVDELASEKKTDAIRKYLRSLIQLSHADYGILIAKDEPDVATFVRTLGFLRDPEEEESVDGFVSYIYRTTCEHLGGLILERLWCGNEAVLEEI